MHICHIVSGLTDGGAEAMLYRLCLADKRHRHTVITLMDMGKYGPLLQDAGVTVQSLNMPRGHVTLKGLICLLRILRQTRPDVVQTWMYHADLLGGVVAYFGRIPVICWGIHHTNLDPGKSKNTTIFVARLCALLSRWIPNYIICCANKAADAHIAMGYDADKIEVIPNGYELALFQHNPEARQRLRAELNLKASIPLIGMVGRFHPMKDHVGLITALKRVVAAGMEFQCILVGVGMDDNNAVLKELIATNGLEKCLQLLGRRDDIPDVMSALDIHVLSSFGEAFPNVLAEAMACGTPCITTDVGDAAIIVGDTGWITPAGQPEVLADAIIQALLEHQNNLAWTERCINARSRIEDNFSIETMINSYSRLWEN
jgi:glycosyltransferase involved in cell wall biosynthesis